MMRVGFKRPLEEKDLWSLNPENCSEKVVSQLVAHWDSETQSSKRSVGIVFSKANGKKSYCTFSVKFVFSSVAMFPNFSMKYIKNVLFYSFFYDMCYC